MITNRTWASTTYAEYVDGYGFSFFRTKNYPISAISRVGVGTTGVMTIENTGTESTATCEVLSTGLSLVLDSGTPDVTVTWVANTTVTAVVAAVNALGSNWAATTVSGYGDFKSSEILTMFPASCIDSAEIYLNIPEIYLNKYTLDKEAGIVYPNFKIKDSYQTVIIDYTAGYTDANVPAWLKQLLVRQGCFWFTQAQGREWGTSSKNFGPDGGTMAFTKLTDNLLPEFMAMAKRNMKHGL